jgi:hypothetical protein
MVLIFIIAIIVLSVSVGLTLNWLWGAMFPAVRALSRPKLLPGSKPLAIARSSTTARMFSLNSSLPTGAIAAKQSSRQSHARSLPNAHTNRRWPDIHLACSSALVELICDRWSGLLGATRSPPARACRYALTDKRHNIRAIQGWLRHRSITSTAVYTALAPDRESMSAPAEE